jgi:hypothetical protein
VQVNSVQPQRHAASTESSHSQGELSLPQRAEPQKRDMGCFIRPRQSSHRNALRPPPDALLTFDIIVVVSDVSYFDEITVSDAPATGSLVFTYALDGSVECSFCTEVLGPGFFGNIDTTISEQFTQVYDFTSIDGTANVAVGASMETKAACGDEDPSCIADVDFSNTEIVTGVQVLNPDGSVDPNAVITAASGTNYNDLVSTAPEPPGFILSVTGVLLAAPALGLKRRSRQARHR